MSETFRSFIKQLVDRTGTQATIASAIGMSASAFSRGVHKEGTLDVMNCLRLAEWAGEPPSRVLRVAGKGDLADLIERLYGPADRVPVNARDRTLMDTWRELDSDVQEALYDLLRVVRTKTSSSNRKRA